MSAACVVANGIRETLAALLGAPVVLRLFEPVVPDPSAWHAIARDAILYRVRGSVADAAIVLRAADAAAFASGVFGEPGASGDRELSPIERDVVDRTAGAIATNLIAVCGARESHAIERACAIDGFISYFEMAVEKPVEARIGIALSRDPWPEPRGSLDLAHLAGVRLRVVAAIDLGNAPAGAVARLEAGALLPIGADDLRRCTLGVAGRRLAHGVCGVVGSRYAIAAKTARETA